MKKIVLNIILIAHCSLFIADCFASHTAGADLTYKCLGGNNYLITLTFYRDCSGITAPGSVTIDFKSSCESFSSTFLLADSSGREVTPTCKAQRTYCSGGNLYGLQQYVYSGQVILRSCIDWEISYSLCCRNYSNTIVNSTGSGLFILATLNNVDAPCSSSPAFSNIPITIVCVGQTFCFNHGAIDPDGDSLVYSLVPPYNLGPGKNPETVTYAHGYSSKQPIPSDPPITLNPLTGQICMTPTDLIISPLAMLVEKFRNGIKVGSVLRDMQVNVIACSKRLPLLSGISSANSQYEPKNDKYIDTICLGKTVDFTVYGFDPDSGNIKISWNKGIPGAKFTVNNNHTPSAYGRFKWTPTDFDLRNSIYCFTVTVDNESCPYFGTQTYSFCISVKGFIVKLDQDVILCKGETYLVEAKADSSVVNFQWELDGKQLSLPSNTKKLLLNSNELQVGNHILGVAAKDNSSDIICPGFAYMRVTVEIVPEINIRKLINICQGKDTVLDAGPSAVRYLWSTGDTTRKIIVNTTDDYYISVYGGYGPQCQATDTVHVNVIPMAQPFDLGKDTCIISNETLFTLDAGNNPPGFQYLWSDGETTRTINITQSGKYVVTVTSAPSSKCYQSDEITVNLLKPHFLGNDITLCSSVPVTINGPLPPDGYAYQLKWLPNGETTQNIYVSGLGLGKSEFMLEVHGGCKDTIDLNVIGCNIKIPNFFSPNSSIDSNRVFAITNIQYFKDTKLLVYNRWGNEVFKSDHYELPENWWDGKDMNSKKDCPVGVYFFVLFVSGKETKSGSVTLLR